ncbi:Mur ligase family protein [Nannocystaceae bacterium ST9]
MELVDTRRLTGANLHDRRPGAVVEVRFAEGEDPESAIASWRAALERGLARLGWRATIHARRFGSGRGAELMFTAEVDRLHAACDLSEWAVRGGDEAGLAAIVEAAAREQAARGGCLPLIERAELAGVAWLIDDDQFTLGHGALAQTWAIGELPEPAALDWASFGGWLPTALITGTNGKTTSARLLARIVRKAGLHVGNTSTDGVYVDERVIDEGDWTGPGGARTLLRRPDVEFAVLEVARGGMLRRGLGVARADAALITNIDDDHLGEYGIETLADLALAKAIVASVVASGGRIVLGAESAPLVELAKTHAFPAPIVWFSPDPEHPVLVGHRAAGGEVCTVIEGVFCWCRGPLVEPLLAVLDAPLTIAGRARHNVENVLGVVGLAHALDLPNQAIIAGLREFGAAVEDNPGRARVWAVPVAGGEVDVLLDFAHNLAGLARMAELVGGFDRSVLISIGMAGDRSDEQLRAIGAALLWFRPRFVVLREQQDYLRGRERGVVPRSIGEGLARAGHPREATRFVDDEPEALRLALAEARPGELIVLLVHTDHEGVAAWLREVGARPSSLLAPS